MSASFQKWHDGGIVPCITLTLYKKGLSAQGVQSKSLGRQVLHPLQQPLTAADQHQHRMKSLSTSSDTSIPSMVLHDFDIFEMVWNRACKLVWEVQASQVLLFFFSFWGGGMWSLSIMPPANNTQLRSTALNCTTGMSSAVDFGTTRYNDVGHEMEYLPFQMSFTLGRHSCSPRPFTSQLQPQ